MVDEFITPCVWSVEMVISILVIEIMKPSQGPYPEFEDS